MGLFRQIRDAARSSGLDDDAAVPAPDDDPAHAAADAAVSEPDAGDDAPSGSAGTLDDAGRIEFSRRGFIAGTSAVGGAGVLAYLARGPAGRHGALRPPTKVAVASRDAAATEALSFQLVPDFTIAVDRDVDLCQLDFQFFGFEVDSSTWPVVLRPTRSTSTVVVQFPPQSIGEAAYLSDANGHGTPSIPEDGSTSPNTGLDYDPPPVLSVMSGPSRLAFAFPPGTSIPLNRGDEQDLLDWSDWTLIVPETAQDLPPYDFTAPPGDFSPYPEPSGPGQLETAIEFPYALYLSPTAWVSGPVLTSYSQTFAARSQPLTSSALVTDLWVASLERIDGLDAAAGTTAKSLLAAVWARDLDNPYSNAYEVGYLRAYDATPETTISYEYEIGAP